MKISFYLSPSKCWWTYLGIRSNPSIASTMDCRFDRAIFFDDPALIPPTYKSSKHNNQYFYILWDGIADETAIEKVHLLLGQNASLTTLVVGDYSQLPERKYKIGSLYADGVLNFSAPPLHFDARTATILFIANIKTIFMPLKNIFLSKGNRWEALKLLFGKGKVVFCGSYGTTPTVLRAFCERYSVDFRLFDRYEFYCNDPAPSLASYKNNLRSNALFLSELYDQSKISAKFFLSTVHLLAREYFLEKIRAAGLDLYTNEFTTGININVYTTPFYSQHVFVDFGSVVGGGNYPRLVDLQYFKKNFIEIEMVGEIDELLSAARSGKLEEHFEQEWELKAPKLLKVMEKRRSNQG